MESLASENWIKTLTADDKVLLINPPVQEIRYAWVKWNQPSDLLMLSSRLKREVGCEVELLDFMLPFESGRVPMRDLAKPKRVGQGEFQMTYSSRTYGLPLEDAKRNLEAVLPIWKPTHVVITTLTSYWFETLLTLIPYLRTLIPSAKVTVMGAYPVVEPIHAKRLRADYLFTDFISLEQYVPDFNLYYQGVTKQLHNDRAVAFGGLKFTKENTVENLLRQVQVLREREIKDFAIFEGNIFRDGCSILDDFLSALEKEKIRINLNGLCGLQISDAVDGIYLKMRKNGFRSFFLEYELEGAELNLDSYGRAYKELRDREGYARIPSGNLTGFVMIGEPTDNLELKFKHCFNLLEICGSIIPKPFTPNPDSAEYKEIASTGKLDLLSPHTFPMAEKSGITRQEYVELYKHTTFLNEKRMGNSFNFFDDRYSSVALKRSLGKKEG